MWWSFNSKQRRRERGGRSGREGGRGRKSCSFGQTKTITDSCFAFFCSRKSQRTRRRCVQKPDVSAELKTKQRVWLTDEGKKKKQQKGGKHFYCLRLWRTLMAILLPEVLVGALECELLIRTAFSGLIPLWVAGLESARLGRLPTASGSGSSIQ